MVSKWMTMPTYKIQNMWVEDTVLDALKRGLRQGKTGIAQYNNQTTAGILELLVKLSIGYTLTNKSK